MKNLEDIYDYFDNATTILIVNKNDSRILSSHLTDYIYKHSKLQKYEIDKCKGLLKRLEKYTSRIIKFNFDFSKFQISSSNARIDNDLGDLILLSYNNNLKLLFEYDLPITYGINRIPSMYRFDLIILVKDNQAIILKSRMYRDGDIINLSSLLRKIKLDKLSNYKES